MTPLDAKVAPLDGIARLEGLWRDLEQRADRSFFLSWPWIGTWIETFTTKPWVVEVYGPDNRIIGLGVFCEASETRKKIIRARQMRLHETGNPAEDVITIEYNTLLTEAGMEEAAWFGALKALQGPGIPRWDELIVSGGTGDQAALFDRLGLSVRRRAETTSAFVDLAKLRAEGITDADGYVGTLGKSTRSQIRRSMKLYRQRGDLALDVAGSLEEAHTFLAELGEWHEAKWQAQGVGGAISKDRYMAFHTAMMARCYGAHSGEVDTGSPSECATKKNDRAHSGEVDTGSPSECATSKNADGEVEFLRARAGDHAFGWLYNFIDRGKVLFYLSGFAFEEDNKLKPGLVTHALAIERHLERGMDAYDFMGGTNRYKTNLGQPGPDVVAYALQRKTPMMMLEGAARKLLRR